MLSFMKWFFNRLLALLAGPILLIAFLSLVGDGAELAFGGLFIVAASLVFIPIFGILAELTSDKSLPNLLFWANVVPAATYVWQFMERGVPSSTKGIWIVFLAASFCAFIYWLIRRD